MHKGRPPGLSDMADPPLHHHHFPCPAREDLPLYRVHKTPTDPSPQAARRRAGCRFGFKVWITAVWRHFCGLHHGNAEFQQAQGQITPGIRTL
jgi:hypothetical protein